MPEEPGPWAIVVSVGYRVGAWEVTGPIASGSWGGVYAARRVEPPRAAHDPPEGSVAALKFLPAGGLTPLQHAAVREIAEAEVRFSGQAEHPRLIRAIETLVVSDPGHSTLDGAVVLVMEQATRSLRDALEAAAGEGPVPDAPRLVTQICEGLVHLHASGWVHGDLKPSNALMMGDGSVRLADFGLTGELEGTHAYVSHLGSSDFLPPEWWDERVSDRGVASRTTRDVWALGVTAHQLLTGGLHPFPGTTARARAVAARSYAAGHAPLRLAETLPPQWRPIVADCLAPDHERRSRHPAPALVARLRALSDGPQPPRAASPVRPSRRRAVAAVALVGAIAMSSARLRGDASTNVVTVYNAEAACQAPRIPDCRLALARDPYAAYSRENVARRVWHGDRLTVDCAIPDGTTVTAESGIRSSRWYRVVSAEPVWLPAVRVEPTGQPALPACR